MNWQNIHIQINGQSFKLFTIKKSPSSLEDHMLCWLKFLASIPGFSSLELHKEQVMRRMSV